MKRLLILTILFACGCKEPTGTQLEDGGAFILPDASERIDTGVSPADTGPADTGPFVCEPACTGSDLCACLDGFPRDCGCHPPQGPASSCDPTVPASCEAGLTCVEALKFGRLEHVCSDGGEGIPCSKDEPSCTTELGCVCIEVAPLGRSCACQGSPIVGGLCDPDVSGSCPPGSACVPVGADGQTQWLCSDGQDGSACQPPDHTDHCNTSLGCNCPLYRGVPFCVCRNPGAVGELCDLAVSGSCLAGLECKLQQDGDTPQSQTSRCVDSSGGTPCDPSVPGSCPAGQVCQQVGVNLFECTQGSTDAGTGGRICDPLGPPCPMGQQCVEVFPGVSECQSIGTPTDAGSGGGGGSQQPCDPLQPLCPPNEFCMQNTSGEWVCERL